MSETITRRRFTTGLAALGAGAASSHSARADTAPSLAQAENRQAVLRSTSSMQSASEMPMRPMRSSWISSPSTIIWVSPIRRSRTWKLRSRSAI